MFHNLHPNLQAYVTCVLNHKFGVQKSQADVAIRQSHGKINRIAVSVPYCRDNLTWELIFRLDDLFSPPDVIAMDTAVEAIPMNNIPQILPSLGDWCPEKEHCLLDLLLQLIALHRFSQVERLRGNDDINRQLFEYETLTYLGVVDTNDLELSVVHAARGICVSFHLPLPLNLDELPSEMQKYSDPAVFLTVSYRVPGQTVVDLKVPTYLRNLIGIVAPPVLTPDATLVDYIPFLKNKIAFMIDECRENYKKKQEYFSAVASRLGTSVLNADSDNYSKISFLVTRGMRKVVFVIDIPWRFPVDKPIVKYLIEEPWTQFAPKELKFNFDQTWTVEKMALETLKAVFGCKIR